mmetsp:Transcript_29845/g.50418  ORF Transcript_29845/g.50418 Transcript_29845/m.50418 type:complete len:233 (-) Transcript_29845:1121-1819(-)
MECSSAIDLLRISRIATLTATCSRWPPVPGAVVSDSPSRVLASESMKWRPESSLLRSSWWVRCMGARVCFTCVRSAVSCSMYCSTRSSLARNAWISATEKSRSRFPISVTRLATKPASCVSSCAMRSVLASASDCICCRSTRPHCLRFKRRGSTAEVLKLLRVLLFIRLRALVLLLLLLLLLGGWLCGACGSECSFASPSPSSKSSTGAKWHDQDFFLLATNSFLSRVCCCS